MFLDKRAGINEAAARHNFEGGNWFCYFSTDDSGPQRILSFLRKISGDWLYPLLPYGAFAYVGDEDGALMVFDGPKGGLLAHTGFTPRGEAGMNSVGQAFMDYHKPGDYSNYGLRLTILEKGRIADEFVGSPIFKVLRKARVVPFGHDEFPS